MTCNMCRDGKTALGRPCPNKCPAPEPDYRDLVERLRREGSDAFHKQYSLGMWKLCADAADAIASLQGDLGRLADAMENLLTNHCRLVESGDCGNWDVDAEPEVAAARALLDALPDRAALSQHPGEGEKA